MDYETGGTTVDWLSGALWIVAALGLVALFILVNSHRVPRAEPDVTAQVEAHFAVGKAPEIAGTSMGFPRALVIIESGARSRYPVEILLTAAASAASFCLIGLLSRVRARLPTAPQAASRYKGRKPTARAQAGQVKAWSRLA